MTAANIKTPLVLLCGGKSSRMGEPKGLLPLGGVPLVVAHAAGFRAAGGNDIVIVLGFGAEAYLAELPWAKQGLTRWYDVDGGKIAVVVNKLPERGQFSSLRTALDWLVPQNPSGAFILPVDLLPPSAQVWRALAMNLTPKMLASIPCYKNQLGHPVLLSAKMVQHLTTIPFNANEARLDHQLHQLAADAQAIVDVADERVIMNINTPEDKHHVDHP